MQSLRLCCQRFQHIRYAMRYSSTNAKDYYGILGVKKNASLGEIKRAFYRLSKKHHPDISSDSARFLEIKEAYDVLRDQEKRRSYDLRDEDPFKNPGDSNYRVYRHYEYKKGGQFDQADFERIWKQFRETAGHPDNRAYDEAFQKARDKIFDEYERRRMNRWNGFAKQQKMSDPLWALNDKIDWKPIRQFVSFWIMAFVFVTLFQYLYQTENEPKNNYPKNDYVLPRAQQQRLESIMNHPPLGPPNDPYRERQAPVDPAFPMGFPRND